MFRHQLRPFGPVPRQRGPDYLISGCQEDVDVIVDKYGRIYRINGLKMDDVSGGACES